MERFIRLQIQSGKGYIGQSIDPVEREKSHIAKSPFWKEMTNPKFEVLYWCLRRNLGKYERERYMTWLRLISSA